MDELSNGILTRVENLSPPPADSSAWKYAFESIVGAAACTLASRRSFIRRETDPLFRERYHQEIRTNLPILLRRATQPFSGEWVDWQMEPLLTWSSGLFMNDAQFRVCTSFEKTLRVAALMLDRENIKELVKAVISDLERKRAKSTALNILKAFNRSYERVALRWLKNNCTGKDERHVFRWLCEDAEARGYALLHVWDLVNNQKHRPSEVRSRKGKLEHLAKPPVEWALTAGALMALCDVYEEFASLMPGCSDAELDAARQRNKPSVSRRRASVQ